MSHDPYLVLRDPNFRRYFSGHFLSLLGYQMQTTAVQFEMYRRTESTWYLALVGLVQFLPVLLFSLLAGQWADRYERRRIIQIAAGVMVCASAGLAWISLTDAPVELIFVCLFANGTARACQQPSKASLLPLLVPRAHLSNAVTWNSGSFQLASIVGPGLAGLVLGVWLQPALVYLMEGTATLLYLSILTITRLAPQTRTGRIDLHSFIEGLRFVWSTKIILGTISLDLLAVLFGGATALLPVYAEKILNVDAALAGLRSLEPALSAWRGSEFHFDLPAVALGLLRTAAAIGALVMSFYITHRPPMERAGRALLWSVAWFGVATIVFGVSRSFWLSFAMLALTGAMDMISVVVRHTLVQLLTPDEMRGRVTAVNGLFIGASNELGSFESGAVAAFFERPEVAEFLGHAGDPTFPPTASVVLGGCGTLLTVAWVAAQWPAIRRYGRLDQK